MENDKLYNWRKNRTFKILGISELAYLALISNTPSYIA